MYHSKLSLPVALVAVTMMTRNATAASGGQLEKFIEVTYAVNETTWDHTKGTPASGPFKGTSRPSGIYKLSIDNLAPGWKRVGNRCQGYYYRKGSERTWDKPTSDTPTVSYRKERGNDEPYLYEIIKSTTDEWTFYSAGLRQDRQVLLYSTNNANPEVRVPVTGKTKDRTCMPCFSDTVQYLCKGDQREDTVVITKVDEKDVEKHGRNRQTSPNWFRKPVAAVQKRRRLTERLHLLNRLYDDALRA